MAHHVLGRKARNADTLDPIKQANRVGQARVSGIEQVDLRRVARHHHPRALTQTGQDHLHLQTRRVLGLIDDDEGMAEGAAAHEGDRRNLDLALFPAASKLFSTQQIGQGLPDRSHIGINLLGQIAGQKAQTLTRLDRRAGHNQTIDLAAQQHIGPVRHRQIGLASSGRAYAKDQLILAQHIQIVGLSRRLGRHHAALAHRHGPTRTGLVA